MRCGSTARSASPLPTIGRHFGAEPYRVFCDYANAAVKFSLNLQGVLLRLAFFLHRVIYAGIKGQPIQNPT